MPTARAPPLLKSEMRTRNRLLFIGKADGVPIHNVQEATDWFCTRRSMDPNVSPQRPTRASQVPLPHRPTRRRHFSTVPSVPVRCPGSSPSWPVPPGWSPPSWSPPSASPPWLVPRARKAPWLVPPVRHPGAASHHPGAASLAHSLTSSLAHSLNIPPSPPLVPSSLPPTHPPSRLSHSLSQLSLVPTHSFPSRPLSSLITAAVPGIL